MFSFLQSHKHIEFKIIINLNFKIQIKQYADKVSAVENNLNFFKFFLNFIKNSALHLNLSICFQFNLKFKI